MKLTKWDKRFLTMAVVVSSWSKDPSTQVGCVIAKGNRIISLGFNGYPAGIEDKEDPRFMKYDKTIHAEINAILYASRSLKGCSIYTYPIPPCARCAAVIIQVGIIKSITGTVLGKDISRWSESIEIAEDMFKEAGVDFYKRTI